MIYSRYILYYFKLYSTIDKNIKNTNKTIFIFIISIKNMNIEDNCVNNICIINIWIGFIIVINIYISNNIYAKNNFIKSMKPKI